MVVGAKDGNAGLLEEFQQRGRWMAEVVWLPDTDECDSWCPFDESLGRQAVHTSVMRDLQHIDRSQCVTLL